MQFNISIVIGHSDSYTHKLNKNQSSILRTFDSGYIQWNDHLNQFRMQLKSLLGELKSIHMIKLIRILLFHL